MDLQKSSVEMLATFESRVQEIEEKVNEAEKKANKGRKITEDRVKEAIEYRLKKESKLGSDGTPRLSLSNDADPSKCEDEQFKDYLKKLGKL
mmetsp:Transcript_16928/g.22776  ORF Transcript_16928/g.22776 Transcript_16928/m.22776 type:complete len:92 (+) Transcript_16928:122-397(+)